MFVSKCMAPAHTAYLGAQAEQSNSVINCVLLCTGVQQPDDTADLRKVMRESASPNLDRTPGVVKVWRHWYDGHQVGEVGAR